jgi:hypothetical protein
MAISVCFVIGIIERKMQKFIVRGFLHVSETGCGDIVSGFRLLAV